MGTEIIKSLVKRFRKSRSIEDWSLLENFIEDKSPCRVCQGPVFYSNSLIRLSKNENLKYDINFPSSRSFREVEGQKFYLSVCQKCLIEEFPEYEKMNKSRVFNVMSKITQFAFQVPESAVKRFTQKTSMTIDNLIKKYGENEGRRRWSKYCELQALTNKFEYKKEKYGWDEAEFREFNRSRAVTLNNMIKRYGEEEGKKAFEEYVKKQKVNGKTLEWFIEKQGEQRGTEIFKEMLKGKLKGMLNNNGYSKPSQDLFDSLDKYLFNDFTTYYHRKNGEAEILIKSGDNTRVFYLDYFIKELNVCIEFFGDYYHANPEKYKDPGKKIKFNRIFTVQEIWDRDKERIFLLENHRGIKTVVVWESDYYRNKNNEEYYKNIIKKCIEK